MAPDYQNYSGCYLNLSDTDWANLKRLDMIDGITAWVCLVLTLLPTLTLGMTYICRYKTTFLMRLFFYLTMAGTLVDLNYALSIVVESSPNKTLTCWWIVMIYPILLLSTLLLESVWIFLINLYLLGTLYVYKSNKHWKYRHCTGRKKRYEFLLVIACHLLCIALMSTAVIVSQFKHNTIAPVYRILLYGPGAIDAALCVVSVVILVGWFLDLKRKHLLKRRAKVVCKEMILVLCFLFVFLFFWSLKTTLQFSDHRDYTESVAIFSYVAFPLSHASTSLFFLAYICMKICPRKRIRKEPRELQYNTTVPTNTIPPSTRVSLPSDTAAHAPNFLSPSSAEPTEVTPLLRNRQSEN